MTRERNGWIDDGTAIRGGAVKCPNCGSSDYRETVSMEKCNSCGLVCDYWGGETNEVCLRYLDSYYAEQEREHQARVEETDRQWYV